MAVIEQISHQVQRLPEPLQAEVLHFVEYLLTRSARDDARREEQEWSVFSLESAMRGIVGESDPVYSETDLKQEYP